jgi:hypothetical protein
LAGAGFLSGLLGATWCARAEPRVSTLPMLGFTLVGFGLAVVLVPGDLQMTRLRWPPSCAGPFERQLQAFEALVETCVVLPFDEDAADVATTIWSLCSRSQRQQLGDLLIAAIAVARQIPLATRNRRDFEAFSKRAALDLRLVDWTALPKRTRR